MRVIIGYGNELRGEDAFGVDVLKELKKLDLKNTNLISTFQLTPEIALELIDADEIIFIDACFSLENGYAIACDIKKVNSSNLTHNIPPLNIIAILNGVYGKYPKYQIFSLLTNNFDTIINKEKYTNSIKQITKWIQNATN